MAVTGLTPAQIAEMLAPYYPEWTDSLIQSLSVYLELLLRWNIRTNLTAIRNPAEIVRRHFGESLFAARHLPACETLLDFGSGAGFPGIPIQLALPKVVVTLAEARNKKASFLREVVRTLALPTEVWGARVEAMPSERVFDVVTMRAVDQPEQAMRLARERLRPGGLLVSLTMEHRASGEDGLTYKLPNTESGVLRLSH